MTNTDKALAVAVAAIYFDDSADYSSALRQIVALLGGSQALATLEENPNVAYQIYAVPAHVADEA